MSTQSDFAGKVADLVRQAKEFGPQVRARVMQLLEEARKEIIAAISNVAPGSFQQSQLRMLSRQIDAAMEKFATDFTASVQRQQDKAFAQASFGVTESLGAAGLTLPSFAGLSDAALAIAQGYTADLISGLSAKAAGDLNGAIQRAFLGGQSVSDVIAQVGRAIGSGAGGDKFTGLFSPIGERAQTIALNEILRMHSIAAQARLEDAKKIAPALQKQWVHVPIAFVPRLSHLVASGQVRDVDQPFDVGGEKLMYPRDPNGSAENTINCHCVLVPYISKDLLTPTAAQKDLLQGAGISVSAG